VNIKGITLRLLYRIHPLSGELQLSEFPARETRQFQLGMIDLRGGWRGIYRQRFVRPPCHINLISARLATNHRNRLSKIMKYFPPPLKTLIEATLMQ